MPLFIRTQHPHGTAKAPASPHTTRAGGADREGHLGRVKARGGRRESRRGDGGRKSIINITGITQKNHYLPDLETKVFNEAPHSRTVGYLMSQATEVALTIACPNRSRAAGYSY